MRKELVRDEVLNQAAIVFERKGFAQSRIEDIAEALELKRSALYYYFRTKNDILRALVEDFVENKARELDQVVKSHEGTSTEKLRTILAMSIRFRTEGGSRLRALDSVWNEMPQDIKADFNSSRRKILNIHTELVREGIAAGEFREMDPRLGALSVLGISNWTSWWYNAKGEYSVDHVVEQLVNVAINGLRAPSTSGTDDATTVGEAIASLERDLANLKSLL